MKGRPALGSSHDGTNGRVSGPAPEQASYGSFVSFSDPDGNSWLFQEVTTRLPGRVDPAVTSFGSASDLAERAAARGGRPRRTREAHRRGRRELARLVRRVHGGGAGRDGTADVSDTNL